VRPRIVVVAKAPVPGRCKTRLCPPFDLEAAALVARAALEDTLEAVAQASTDGSAPLLALDGEPGPWLRPGFDVVPQLGTGLDERLAAAFEAADGPALLIGMDTPQVTAPLLRRATLLLEQPDVDAVFGPAFDGGWWALGLKQPDPDVLLGVPMSTPWTGLAQTERLRARGLRTTMLSTLQDVDRFSDALAVARLAPRSRFASEVRRCLRALVPAGVAS